MKNTLKLSIGALASLAMWAAPAHAEFSDPGTDYSIATVDRWSDDQINEFVSKANSFACVIKNARPDAMPNAMYEVLMSEVECGLMDEALNASGVSNKDTLSSSIMKTSRASSTSSQEGQFWFNSQDEAKFVGNVVIKKSSDVVPPYGEWSLSYYMNTFDGNYPSAGLGQGDEFTAATTPVSGYVDIAPATTAEGGGIIMNSFEKTDMTKRHSTCGGTCQETTKLVSKIQYYDAALASSRILGRDFGTDGGGNAQDILTAAKTNATHIYKRVFSNGAGGASTQSCTKRDSTWKTVHQYGVYNKSTGDKVKLAGGFGFDYMDGSTENRGFVSLNGAFFDNPATAFTVAAPTKAVTAQNESATPYTLNWAPGKLAERAAVSEALPASGISYFTKYIDNATGANQSGEVQVQVKKVGGTFQATYHPLGSAAGQNAISDPFNGIADDALVKKVASGGTNAGIDDHDWMGEMYSMEKRTWIHWDGGVSINFFNEKNASTDATLLAKSTGWTALSATQHNANATVANFPISASAWFNNSTNAHAYSRKANSGIIVGGGSAKLGDTFYFTALTPPTGKLARTLYIDPTGNGPSSDDRALMFNFSANERSEEYTSFAATPVTATMEITQNSKDFVQWPYKTIELKDLVTNKEYKWRTGAFGWDNSVIAIKANGSVYTMDEPMILTYTHAAVKDMNNTKEITFVKEWGNQHDPVPSLCGVPAGGARTDASNNPVTECVVEPSDFGTKVYSLRYNGKWVDGLPDMEGRASENDSNGFRVTMINPIAGTVVTSPVAGVSTQFVLKPLAVSESFLKEPNMANCSGIAFSALTPADFGWTSADLPISTLVPTPAHAWANKPVQGNLKCTVNSGDASQCSQ